MAPSSTVLCRDGGCFGAGATRPMTEMPQAPEALIANSCRAPIELYREPSLSPSQTSAVAPAFLHDASASCSRRSGMSSHAQVLALRRGQRARWEIVQRHRRCRLSVRHGDFEEEKGCAPAWGTGRYELSLRCH